MSRWGNDWRDWKPPVNADGRVENAPTPAKPSKYRNQVTEIDGHRFDSKREGAHYVHLKLRQSAGDISKLECQPRFDLHTMTPSGEWVIVGSFRPDFRYRDKDGVEVIEDVKSKASRTEAYQMRKRHLEAEYGVVLVEIE